MADYGNHLLFNAHALTAAADEPHAREGNHLRVNTHPLLGLPVAPFIVSRGQVFLSKERNWRTQAAFVNRRGQLLAPPFDVTQDNPVTAYIANTMSEHCIWAQVNGVGLTVGEEVKLDCDAYMDSSIAPALIGRRSRPRYAFSGPCISRIEIGGRGRVTGIQWLADADLKGVKMTPFAIMNLPHEGGLRYIAIADPMKFAEARVMAQAPKRVPLQETQNAPPPLSAPLADASFEADRVASLSETLHGDLEELINDGSTHPLIQAESSDVFDPQGRLIGVSQIKRIARVMQHQSDHGTASHLGYKMLDTEFIGRDEQLIVYRADGYFCDLPATEGKLQRHQDQMVFDALLANIPIGLRSLNHAQIIEQFFGHAGGIDGVKQNGRIREVLEPESTYVTLSAVAIADIGAPLDQVERVTLPGTRQSSWIPALPPAAQREIEVDLRGARVAALLAAGSRAPANGTPSFFMSLNRENNRGFHIPLALSLDFGDGTSPPPAGPGSGFVADRNAPPGAVRYFVAQQDRFGRWSEWTSIVAPPGVRPKPPRPHVQARYAMPTIAQAAAQGGTVTVRIPVPDTASLAPGSHLLQRAHIRSRDRTANITQSIDVLASAKTTTDDPPTTPNGPPQRYFVEVSYAGPVLQPTAIRELEILAFWVDTAGVFSVESEKQILKLNDPRPPAQLEVPHVLQYSARPDVTGLAWIEHRWHAAAGQANFSIYYTDENRLQAHLASIDKQKILDDLGSAAHAAARATIYRENAPLFPDHLFEKLRDAAQSFNGGETGFRHAVSGSLRILSFYKIAAESASGARPALVELPLIVYGVPNSDPPQRPIVTVKPSAAAQPPGQYAADVTIAVSPGATRALTWRLRRTRGDAQSPNMLPVAATGQFAAVAGPTDAQVVTHTDTGPLQISSAAKILPWVRYTWVADVQGVPESGSVEAGTPVEGRWSVASDPVSLVLIPSDAPSPVALTVTGNAGGGGFVNVAASILPPAPLLSGAIGAFRVRLQRQKPGQLAEILAEIDGDGAGPFTLSGHAPGNVAEIVPGGTRYTAILLDPLGRQSPAVTWTLT